MSPHFAVRNVTIQTNEVWVFPEVPKAGIGTSNEGGQDGAINNATCCRFAQLESQESGFGRQTQYGQENL